jgi:hypothetical protein
MAALPVTTQRVPAPIAGSPRRSFMSRLAAMLGRADMPRRAELAALRPATRLLIVGLAAWIGMVVLATMIAVASVMISTLSFSVGGLASAAPGTEIRPAAGFENILQRPLFSRSRQAAAVAAVVAPVAAPAMLDQNITLKGVFINGPLAKAFLISPQNPLGVWVQANDEIAGWRVVAVKPDQVLLDAQNEKLAISLSVNGAAK